MHLRTLPIKMELRQTAGHLRGSQSSYAGLQMTDEPDTSNDVQTLRHLNYILQTLMVASAN